MTVISAWWRLNIQFKDPVGDRVGVELLFNSVEFGVPKQLPGEFQTVETRCGKEGHTRPRGPSETPDGVDPNIRRTRKTQRDGHNSGVKIWSLCSVSSTLSHASFEQPFQTLAINWEVNIFVKKSSCVLHSCVLSSCVFVLASVLILCRCDAEWCCRWLYNTLKANKCCHRTYINTEIGGKAKKLSSCYIAIYTNMAMCEMDIECW